jgi:hypothetical protein
MNLRVIDVAEERGSDAVRAFRFEHLRRRRRRGRGDDSETA